MALENRKFKKDTRINKKGETVLHLCAEYGRVEMFKWFQKYFIIDVKVNDDAGETPLMIACREGKKKIVELYINEYKGLWMADKKSNDGWTAL